MSAAERKAWISGCKGPALTDDERRFFADERPWGFILFARNIADAPQLQALCAELSALAGGTVPIFVDQEGGRVQRLRPPLAPVLPAAKAIGDLYGRDAHAGQQAAFLHGALIAANLKQYGINADCIPCLDIACEDGHSVIGDRALNDDVQVVALLGRKMAEGAMAGGVLPVMKHIPGHGRANADSHFNLPHVDATFAELAKTDFLPFAELADLPAAMTAHVLFSAIDPLWPATLSPTIISQIIRQTIGFDGLLMSDDISMKALKGNLGESAAMAIEAGCDIVLHCNGDLAEMRAVAGSVPELNGDAAHRAESAMAIIGQPADIPDFENLWDDYQQLMALTV
ncbi:beta-N-acetylhexosaminidase [Aureimonas fodinaquatilis]|uniref:beta-N-acetylhexosaminidase n=1 Tax=Aureimonas fodinaquatilis TaxID=2565783 RepID=UPI001FEAA563|nr:beta-N-acetylhexosaminidase [Aureimonas fodinaquatilis]